MSTETPTTPRQQLAALAKTLKVPYWHCREDGAGIALIAGSRGKIVPTDDGSLLVMPGHTSSPSLALQLSQSGLLADPRNFVLSRMPTDAEAALLRDLLGLQSVGKRQDSSANAAANGAPT
jgi:hypothetical protein